MTSIDHLFERNRKWSYRIASEDPEFFERLSKIQTPEYLWIGCSDSRVPANEITGLLPGEVFVHRNVANQVVHSDLNCLSVLQFAVDVLRVEHILVVGHYGCGGVKAAHDNLRLGLVDNWLRPIQELRDQHRACLADLPDEPARINRLCELNVIEQVHHVCHTTVLQQAWSRSQAVTVHGWIFGLDDGILRDLKVSVDKGRNAEEICKSAVAALGNRACLK